MNFLKHSLHQPSLSELAEVLNESLISNFAEVNVKVVNCPNLTDKPFNLTCQGLEGSTTLLEVGGPPYLLPLANKEKIYDLKELVKLIDVNPCFIIGAGAGPWQYAKKNCELIGNLKIMDGNVINGSRIAKVKDEDNSVIAEILPDSETRFALLANFFCSNGLQGKVLEVSCCKRKGEIDFITCIRNSLNKKYANKPVGLGGTFLFKKGIAKQHVMPDFSTIPLKNDDELNKWLKFYDMPSPLVAVGYLISSNIPNFDLRLQHFHSFGENLAGHFHYDVTPDDVEYLAYFNIAEQIFRVDKPESTHDFGRD